VSALDDDEVRSFLATLPGWSLTGGQVVKEYRFPSFMEAVAFVNRVADKAEQADHHPDLDIRYDRVRVALRTHSADGVTDKDLALARSVESECGPPA
jgi:4a-hydroxytetrahydrobiopterin dehydratase